ncbi:uncharacterized protein JCM6883_002735 [Sporobolomyces salmoneus]|uniref:uncharacterized protein n=1 Tax=Sporobolomyces salmoneus TaxID=183962 RepID=UPI00316E7997
MSFTLHQFDANTAAPTSITRSLSPSPTTSSSPNIPTSTNGESSSYSNSTPYDYNSSAFTTSWITYLAIIVVAGVLVALISSRYFYIRRYYVRPSLRAYFLPKSGIHIPFLRIHIDGAPNRTVVGTMTTLDEVYGASAGQRGERRRRRRRGRQTVGETLGPGGARIGERDQDDEWDEEEEIERNGAGGERGELPMYEANSGLPAYAAPPVPMTTINRTTTRQEGDEVDALPTAAEYEALSRGNRDGTTNNNLPTYPPPVHVHGSNSLYPTEPPPSFSRANSGVSTRSRRNPVVDVANDSTSTFETSPDDDDDEERRRTREEDRRQSTATASSSASKLDDDDLESIKSTRKDSAATGSKVTLGSSTSTSSTDQEKKEADDKAQ